MIRSASEQRLQQAILAEIAKEVGDKDAAEVERLLEKCPEPAQRLSDHEMWCIRRAQQGASGKQPLDSPRP